MEKKYRIGTRGSKLALAQTRIVTKKISRIYKDIVFEVCTIKTKGDVDRTPLFMMDRKGIFEKEIDQAVIDKKIDLAVHSIKDVPSDIPRGLIIGAILKREKPNDVLISKNGVTLNQLQPGSVIGTSSLRRAVQLKLLRKDLNIIPLRGNVETRIKKVKTGELDAIVLAEAGIKRLNASDVISEKFKINKFVPAPGQGAIAVICRDDNVDLRKVLAKIDDKYSRISILAERSLLDKIESGCRFPIGAIAYITKNQNMKLYKDKSIINSSNLRLNLYAKLFSSDGTKSIDLKLDGDISKPKQIGIKMANLLIKHGALELSKDWDEALNEWNGKRK